VTATSVEDEMEPTNRAPIEAEISSVEAPIIKTLPEAPTPSKTEPLSFLTLKAEAAFSPLDPNTILTCLSASCWLMM